MRWPGPRDPIPANMRQVLALPFACEPGTAFQYKPDPQIIVYLLEEIYHESITELFRSRLLSCFSSRACEWDREDVQGMRLSLPLLNELGQLMLNRGVLGGKRIFSEEYHAQMVTEYSAGGFPECLPYGLSWWLDRSSSVPHYSACGFGGQKLVIVPQQQKIISVLCDMDAPHPQVQSIVDAELQQ